MELFGMFFGVIFFALGVSFFFSRDMEEPKSSGIVACLMGAGLVYGCGQGLFW